jgi:hypothetical protein
MRKRGRALDPQPHEGTPQTPDCKIRLRLTPHRNIIAVLSDIVTTILASWYIQAPNNKTNRNHANACTQPAWRPSWPTAGTLLVDLPALWCFAEGAALSFWVI